MEEKRFRIVDPDEPVQVVRPKGGRRRARVYELKQAAEARLVVLLLHGAEGDRLARQASPVCGMEIASLSGQRRLGRMPRGLRIVVLRSKIDRLETELTKLRRNGTEVKRRLMESTILRQIEEASRDITEASLAEE